MKSVDIKKNKILKKIIRQWRRQKNFTFEGPHLSSLFLPFLSPLPFPLHFTPHVPFSILPFFSSLFPLEVGPLKYS